MIETAGDLLRGMIVEARRDPVMIAMAIVFTTVLAMLGDLGGAAMMPVSFLAIAVAAFVLQYVLTRRAMRAGGLLADDAPGNVGAFFGLGLLSGLGILLGITLLILPGIWLYARWLAATPILFADDIGVTEALATSVERTRPLLWPIIVAAGIVNVPYVLAMAATFLLPEQAQVAVGPSLAINLGLNGSQIAAWYLAIAIYRAIRPEPVEAVFA